MGDIFIKVAAHNLQKLAGPDSKLHTEQMGLALMSEEMPRTSQSLLFLSENIFET